MKNILSFLDGTWDTTASDTNVYRLYKTAVASANQVAFYSEGIGATGDEFQRLMGGGLGVGIEQKLQDAYSQICHVYEPGDKIFLFGFSRGAETARALASMIGYCGLPAASFSDKMVSDAWEAYMNRNNLPLFEVEYAPYGAKVHCLGIFDTVSSLGIGAAVGGVDPISYAYIDTTIHADVENVFHACAIDERRKEFSLTPLGTVGAGQNAKEIFFSGCHGDIGGGNGTSLSDITFSWMLNAATGLGMVADPAVLQKYAKIGSKYSLDKINESWSIFWGFPHWRPIAKTATIANSVAVRLQNDPSYRPENIPFVCADSIPPLQIEDVVAV